ncbi:MAG: flavin monoamine oxidase family protein [bacterium]
MKIRILDNPAHFEPLLARGVDRRAETERIFLARVLGLDQNVLHSPAFGVDKLYREIISGKSGPLSAKIGGNFTVLARAGEMPNVSPQAGDVLVRIALGEPGLEHVAVISDSTLWSHKQLANAPCRPESQQPGFYTTVIEGGAFPHTHSDRFARRILDSEGKMPPGQLLLRPTSSIGVSSLSSSLTSESPFLHLSPEAFDEEVIGKDSRSRFVEPEEPEDDPLKKKLPLSQPSGQSLKFSSECQKQLKNTSVAVVGGGLAGLMAARRLGQYGVKVSVFEARPQVGGRVLSNHTFSNGRITEEGAELIGSFHTKWLALAQEYGLAVISRMGEELYMRADLNVKLTLDKPLSNDEISKLGNEMKVRVLEPIARDASQLIRIDDPSQPWLDPGLMQYDNMSVADALAHRYGVKPTERLWKAIEFLLVNNEVAPLEEMNFLGLLCKVKGGQSGPKSAYDDQEYDRLMGYWNKLEIFRCADGCQKLATEIANEIQTKKYGVKLGRNSAVTHINLSKQGVTLGFKKVIKLDGTLAEGHPTFLHYDFVILAIPPSVWAGVKITADGKDAHPKDQIGLMGMGPAVKFFSDVKERFWINEKAAPSGGSLTLGQVWEGTDNQTRLDPKVAKQGIVLSVFAGPIIPIPIVAGGASRRTPNQDEFNKGLRLLYPGYTRNLNKPLFSNWPNVPFIKTGYASPRKGQIFTIGQALTKPFHDRLFFAGEHTQMNFFGYMEGALLSGERAAETLMLQSCDLLKESAPASPGPSVRTRSGWLPIQLLGESAPASPSPSVRTASAAPIRAKTAFEHESQIPLEEHSSTDYPDEAESTFLDEEERAEAEDFPLAETEDCGEEAPAVMDEELLVGLDNENLNKEAYKDFTSAVYEPHNQGFPMQIGNSQEEEFEATDKRPLQERPVKPVEHNYVPPAGKRIPVTTGQSWVSIAKTLGIDAWDLIDFNFPGMKLLWQEKPELASRQVNWYLSEYVGCQIPTADKQNWAFTSGLTKGKGLWKGGHIFLPPPKPSPSAPAPPPCATIQIPILKGLSWQFQALLSTLNISLPSQARCLSAAELATAKPIYGGSLDYADIYVSDTLGLSGRPFTTAIPIGTTRWVVVLNLGPNAFKSDTTPQVLIHELAHAWQSQHHPNPWQYMYNCVLSQMKATAATAATALADKMNSSWVTRGIMPDFKLGPASAYAYVPGMLFGDYGGEQIAQQVEDYHYPPAGLIQSADARGQMENIWKHIKSLSPRVPDNENIRSLSETRYAHKSYPNVVWH